MATPDGILLRQLRRAAPESVAVSELAASSGLESQEVVRRISALESAGYTFVRHPHWGIAFRGAPSHLVAEDLAAMVEGAVIGREIVTLMSTRSTNDLALQAGVDGAGEGLVFIAESQSAGRGRQGREWQSPLGLGLYLSVLLRPKAPAREWPRLALAAALACAKTCERFVGVRAGIKWPNDILFGGKKIAGILLESRLTGAGQGHVVVGIGLNVNHARSAFPPELQNAALSLAVLLGQEIARDQVALALLAELEHAYRLTRENFPHIRSEVESRSTLPGCHVDLDLGDRHVCGKVLGLDEEGGLILETHDGEHAVFHSGEVVRVESRATAL